MPLIVFAADCPYRPHVLRGLDSAGRAWRIVYTGTSLASVQAAITAGFGVSVLARSTLRPDFRAVGKAGDLPDLPATEIALYRGRTGAAPLAVALGAFLEASFTTRNGSPG